MKIVLSKLLLNLSCYLCQFFVSWWSYSDCLSHSVTQPGEITSRRSSTELAHVWNKAVDETLGRLVVYLSSRGWWLKHHFEHGKWGSAQGSARLSSHCCAETQLMYLTFLCTRSWTCFVLKASPVTYLFWIWLILPYIVPWTRIRMLPHGQCSNPGESLVPLNVIHIYVE